MSYAKQNESKAWMRQVLWAAAFYNICWGAWTVLFPNALFHWAGMPVPNYPEIWQCVGMVVGVYGVAYAAAARNPMRHWPVVLAGLLGKVLGPVGMVQALWNGTLPLRFGVTCLANDLIWWIPFGFILLAAWRAGEMSRP